jgi:xylulokinase
MSIAGLDVGTTGCKVVVISADGFMLANSNQEYNIIKPRNGWTELDSDEVWECVKQALNEVANKTTHDPIEAISISSMGDTVTPFDRKFKPLYNSILAFDTRTADEAIILKNELGKEWIYNTTGMPPHAMHTACKILWIKRHLPEVFRKTYKFLCYEEFIMARLGAQFTTSYSNAAFTMLFNINKKVWEQKILQKCDIGQEQLPKTIHSAAVVGKISKKLSHELGLPEKIKLISGGHDQACAVLGSGIGLEKAALDSTGAFESFVVSFNHPVLTNQFLNSGIFCYPHCYNDRYCLAGQIFTAGATLRWFRDQFGYEDYIEAKEKESNVYRVIDSKLNHKPTNIFFIPHLSGSGSPKSNPRAKGNIYGINLSTTKYHIAQAILEGITYELKINLDLLESSGIQINEIKCSGGGSKSKYWLQLKANITGRTITASKFTDLAALGAAILAGYAIGTFSTIETGIKALKIPTQKYYPNKETYQLYMDNFERYKVISDTIVSLYEMV